MNISDDRFSRRRCEWMKRLAINSRRRSSDSSPRTRLLRASILMNTFINQGLRELLEISQRSLSTPVQRSKRPAPTIHKEVSGCFCSIVYNSCSIDDLQVQTEAVGEEVEVVTLPRPGAARTAIVKSLPTIDPNLQEDETGGGIKIFTL